MRSSGVKCAYRRKVKLGRKMIRGGGERRGIISFLSPAYFCALFRASLLVLRGNVPPQADTVAQLARGLAIIEPRFHGSTFDLAQHTISAIKVGTRLSTSGRDRARRVNTIACRRGSVIQMATYVCINMCVRYATLEQRATRTCCLNSLMCPN